MSVFKTQLAGYLGQDATVQIVNGKQVINGSVAHSEKWKDAQGVQKEKTTWVNFSWWTDRNGIVQYLKKGQLVFIEGQVEARNYTTRTGENIAQLQLRVHNLNLLGGQTQRTSSAPNPFQGSNSQSDISGVSEDIPF